MNTFNKIVFVLSSLIGMITFCEGYLIPTLAYIFLSCLCISNIELDNILKKHE